MSLRVPAVQNHESRPLPPERENKKPSLFKRWGCSSAISLRNRNRHNSNNDTCNHQPCRKNQNNGSTSMTSSTSYDSFDIDITFSPNETNISNRTDRSQNSVGMPKNKLNMATCKNHVSSQSAMKSRSGPVNIMHWMQYDCPKDVIPLVLAFAGPQKMATIGRINRFWRQVFDQEATWNRLCESLYKWKEGDSIPDSWKKYYLYNPSVPNDYSDIHTAINKVVDKAKKDPSKPRSVRILLRPGQYFLRKAITMDESNTEFETNERNNHSVTVTIETMSHLPLNCLNNGIEKYSTPSIVPPYQCKRKLKNSIRNIFRCRTIDVENEDDFLDHDILNEFTLSSEGVLDNLTSANRESNLSEANLSHRTRQSRIDRSRTIGMNRASLILTTRRQNEPLFRIRQGSMMLRNIDLRHGSLGSDIWNGNSAIQIQPNMVVDVDSVIVPTPIVTLDGVDVTSSTGRGVVNIDGGHLKISNSHIHDCAATGIYIGGLGSRATIEHSDVTFNGKGNRRSRRGIAAGHSGIYLEQGNASIVDCNISCNSLTGISAISPDNAWLKLQESDLVSNGTYQLEMPDVGSVAYRNSVTTNNNLSSSGRGRSRSALLLE